jgi:membrane protein YqaA with SNARE-associated domain
VPCCRYRSAKTIMMDSALATFRHLGAFGLFFLAVLDSSPFPTFGGPDILLVILVSTHRNPWYVDAVIATVGSMLGACGTFGLARKAGEARLQTKFGPTRVSVFLRIFKKRGTATLVASTAVPFPFPTSLFFATAGASDYSFRKFLAVVMLSRVIRYTAISLVAQRYGGRLIGMLRHPTEYWSWLLLLIALAVAVIIGGILFKKRLPSASLH